MIGKLFVITLGITGLLRAAPEKWIFDTDMGNDIDDAMALAIIHELQSRDVVELLAVTSSKDHPWSAPYIDAVNTFYGRPDIPLGAVRKGATTLEGKYLKVAKRKNGKGKLVYPHDLESGNDCMEAVALIRKTLAGQPDGSVSILQVGFFTNLVRLLDSQPDEFSPLAGEQLIQKKVKQLGLMAGSFTPIDGNKRYLEFNVKKDISSARELAKRWPGKMVWSGFEIGMAVRYPTKSIEDDFGYVANHPVKEGYLAYCGLNGRNATFDLTTVLQMAYPDRGYFDLSEKGRVTVENDGFTSFVSGKGEHVFLKMSEKQAVQVEEAFVQMVSSPPRK